jgi:hypothetical protein
MTLDELCSICEDITLEEERCLLHCGHSLCETCSSIWFQIRGTCPLCRIILPPITKVSEQDMTNSIKTKLGIVDALCVFCELYCTTNSRKDMRINLLMNNAYSLFVCDQCLEEYNLLDFGKEIYLSHKKEYVQLNQHIVFSNRDLLY